MSDPTVNASEQLREDAKQWLTKQDIKKVDRLIKLAEDGVVSNKRINSRTEVLCIIGTLRRRIADLESGSLALPPGEVQIGGVAGRRNKLCKPREKRTA